MPRTAQLPDTVQIKIRVPIDVKNWLLAQAKSNCSSQSSEIVRAIRHRMSAQRSEQGDLANVDPKIASK
jgi:hypothetical protein